MFTIILLAAAFYGGYLYGRSKILEEDYSSDGDDGGDDSDGLIELQAKEKREKLDRVLEYFAGKDKVGNDEIQNLLRV